jgi:fumarate hydratase class II
MELDLELELKHFRKNCDDLLDELKQQVKISPTKLQVVVPLLIIQEYKFFKIRFRKLIPSP